MGSIELIDNSGGLNGASPFIFFPPFLSPSVPLVSAFHWSTLRHSARVWPRNSTESSIEHRSEGGVKEKERDREEVPATVCLLPYRTTWDYMCGISQVLRDDSWLISLGRQRGNALWVNDLWGVNLRSHFFLICHITFISQHIKFFKLVNIE